MTQSKLVQMSQKAKRKRLRAPHTSRKLCMKDYEGSLLIVLFLLVFQGIHWANTMGIKEIFLSTENLQIVSKGQSC